MNPLGARLELFAKRCHEIVRKNNYNFSTMQMKTIGEYFGKNSALLTKLNIISPSVLQQPASPRALSYLLQGWSSI